MGGKGLRVNVKEKGSSYYLGRKVVFRKWILVVTVVRGLVVILFSLRNVRSGLSLLFWCAKTVESTIVLGCLCL